MLIFFGTRSARIESRHIRYNTECKHCGSQNSFAASLYGSYFHVFWIPVFRFSKTIIVECTHCKKTYDSNELSQNNKNAVDKSYLENPPNKAYWHNLGCFFILFFIGFTIISSMIVGISSSMNDDYDTYDDDYSYEEVVTENDIADENETNKTVVEFDNTPKWERQLKNDMRYTDYSPEMDEDSHSYILKICLESNNSNLNTSSTAYYTDRSYEETLVLVEIDNLEELTETQREGVYSQINVCVNNIIEDSGDNMYIGAFCNGTFYMISTPNGTFKNDEAQIEKLKSFY